MNPILRKDEKVHAVVAAYGQSIGLRDVPGYLRSEVNHALRCGLTTMQAIARGKKYAAELLASDAWMRTHCRSAAA